MTCKEKLEALNPGCNSDNIINECCPSDFNYLLDPDPICNGYNCDECWNREIPEEKNKLFLLSKRSQREKGELK